MSKNISIETFNGCAIHDFIFGYGFILVEYIWSVADRFPFQYGNFHVLYFNPDQKEINFAHNHIFQMIPNNIKYSN